MTSTWMEKLSPRRRTNGRAEATSSPAPYILDLCVPDDVVLGQARIYVQRHILLFVVVGQVDGESAKQVGLESFRRIYLITYLSQVRASLPVMVKLTPSRSTPSWLLWYFGRISVYS